MIGGIFLLASVVAVFIVFNWFKDNDGKPENEPTTGLLAMSPPDSDPKKPEQRRWTRAEALRKAGRG